MRPPRPGGEGRRPLPLQQRRHEPVDHLAHARCPRRARRRSAPCGGATPVGERDHVVDRWRQPSIQERAGARCQHQGLGRRAGPGPRRRAGARRAGCPRAGRRAPASRIASTTLSPTGMWRTRRCAASRSAAFSTGCASASSGRWSRAASAARRRVRDSRRRCASGSGRAAPRAADMCLPAPAGSGWPAHGTAAAGVVLAGDRDAALLHGLQQRRLGARTGAVDLVRHQQLAEHGTLDETEGAPSGFAFSQRRGDHDGLRRAGAGVMDQDPRRLRLGDDDLPHHELRLRPRRQFDHDEQLELRPGGDRLFLFPEPQRVERSTGDGRPLQRPGPACRGGREPLPPTPPSSRR